MALQPQGASGDGRIDRGLVPPGQLVTAVMDLAMMSAAQRDRELVADLAAKGWRLRKLQVVSVSGNPTADQARELGNRFHMLPVANPPRRR